MRKPSVDTCKFPRSIRLAVALLALFVFSLLVYSPYPVRVPIAHANPDVASFYPSGYNLYGSTKYLSGSVTDLQSDNVAYMTFRSYVSASSTTAKTNAFIAYRDSTTSLNTPKEKTWTGDTATWGSQSEMSTAGSPVRFARVAYSPKEQKSFEKIVVTLSDDGQLDAYIWDGTAWVVFNNIASSAIWSTAPEGAQRPYDVVYETNSGRAFIVYEINIADSTKDLAYRIWNGTTLLAEQYIDFTGVTSTNPTISFVVLASNPDSSSNQIAMIFNEYIGGAQGHGNAFAAIWDGSAWTKMTTLTTNISVNQAQMESISIQYSTYYKKILAVSGDGSNSMAWKTYTQGDADWVAQTAFDPDPDNGDDVCFGTLKRDPSATATDDYIMYAGVNDLWDLNAFAFDMADTPPSRLNTVNEVDDALDSGTTRPIDFDWEPTGNKGLIVWGTLNGNIHYNTYSISAGWGASWTTSVPMGANTHLWVQLRRNTRSISGAVKILGAVLEDTTYYIGAIKWNGTTFTVIGTNTISSGTTVSTYECFEIEFQRFGPPTEFTSEVEFTGTSNTQSWTQLVWTVDSSFTTASVTTTLQLYNWITGYPTSGDGFMTDTIGTSDVNKTQTITTNPTNFRDSSGNWKMKIKGVKSIGTQFDWKGDLVKIEVTWGVGYALNLRVRDWDLTDNIQGAIVYKGSDTKTSDSNGWANWTAVSGTVQIKVKYYGFWVNGTFSVTMSSDKTIDVKCKLHDVTVKVQETQHNAYLVSANVTVFNASSTSGNKIKSGITGSNGQVSFTNLPNNTLVFTQYGGSSYSIVIGNTTQTVSSEDQSITLTSNQNYVSTSSPYSVIALLGLIIPLKKRSQLDVSRADKVKKCKRR